MGLLAPGILAGLVALGLPVYLHLLRQHKTTPRPFSSLMFFDRRIQSSVKHRRLKYLVLFSLRCLFIALLLLAFARPFIEWTGVASAHSGRVLAFFIDDSFSMREGDRLARAKQQALEVASGIHADDRAQVATFGGPTRLLTNLTNDRGATEAAIRGITPGDGASSFAEVTRAIRSLAQSAHAPVEAHVFSDFQKSSWPANFSDLRLPQGTRLVPHRVTDSPVPNLAVENVIAPRRLFNAKSGAVQATLVSYSDKDATPRVSLVVNGNVIDTKPAKLPAGGRAAVEFTGIDAPYGLNRGEVRIDSEDAFTPDDHFYFAVERSDPAPALFVEDASGARSALYFDTALQAANQPAFSLIKSSYAQAASTNLDRFAFVVLSDPAGLPRGFEDNLTKYVRNGGSVLFLLGHNAAGRVPVADLSTAAAAPSNGTYRTATDVDQTHPALKVPAHWDAIRFYRVVPVQAGTARVLMRLDDGAPVMLERAIGEGRVIVFASAFDNNDSDLPVRPLFVPFVQDLTGYLGRVETATGTYTAGAFYDLRPADAKADTPVEVTGPSGERLLSLSESRSARSLPLESQGFYDIRRQNGRHELAAVNPDRRESDFTPLPADTLTLWQNTGMAPPPTTVGSRTNTTNEQTQLWWWVLLAALLLAVAESLIGNRHLDAKEGAA
jgi:hypothetical protein